MKKETIRKNIILRGMPANKGVVIGKVRIVSDVMNDELMAKELHKIKKGEILVAEMTRPLFVICMRKVAAIVTDRGGILCHAAMVSREFNIPCIVGAGNATKILKNGQKILVDANKGIIYGA
ncbi:MAG: PEP-utilizing enzyme [bacterium]